MTLPRRARWALNVQRALSYTCFTVLWPVMAGLFRFRHRFSVQALSQVRAQYRALRAAHPGPMLICTNHLTLVDSIVQAIILGSPWGYLKRLSALPWNLPEAANYRHRPLWRLICYLGRCIPVQRGAPPEQARLSLAKMRYVLTKGDAIAIFPEGKRSQDGRVDDRDFSYGAGQLLNQVAGAAVLCVYLRGMRFGGFADYPKAGERFYLRMQMFTPQAAGHGLRRAREISAQIVARLKAMEADYFAARQAGLPAP